MILTGKPNIINWKITGVNKRVRKHGQVTYKCIKSSVFAANDENQMRFTQRFHLHKKHTK